MAGNSLRAGMASVALACAAGCSSLPQGGQNNEPPPNSDQKEKQASTNDWNLAPVPYQLG